MIVNAPTFEGLNDIALRLYFAAWDAAADIEPTFCATYDSNLLHAEEPEPWKQEWQEYLRSCQPELQSACATLQHSAEIALKARICKVSPYLLLLCGDLKLSTKRQDIEFSTLRTLDANDLPAAVNSICENTLSERFITHYHSIRALRNRFMHLGMSGELIEPSNLLNMIVFQYIELWPERHWLRDRVETETNGQRGTLYDGKYASAEMNAMIDWQRLESIVTNSQFKSLFGRSKTGRRYSCHECFDRSNTRLGNFNRSECRTAALDETGVMLTCFMCGEAYPVIRQKCTSCRGNVLGRVHNNFRAEGDLLCHTCGEDQEVPAAS